MQSSSGLDGVAVYGLLSHNRSESSGITVQSTIARQREPASAASTSSGSRQHRLSPARTSDLRAGASSRRREPRQPIRKQRDELEINLASRRAARFPRAPASASRHLRTALWTDSVLAAGATRVTLVTPALTVSPSTRQFAATSTNGAVTATTGAQSISLSGFGWTSNRTATASAPWLQLSALGSSWSARAGIAGERPQAHLQH